jgi:protein O-GlcNAc transferase
MTLKPWRNAENTPSEASLAKPATAAIPDKGQLEAIALLKAGRLDEAAAAFERVIAADPENWQSIHLLGLVAYRQGKLERAAQLIKHCLTINPTLAEAYSDLGVVLKDIGDLDDAQAACEKAISLKPGFHPAHNNLGNIFKAQRRTEDAVACYERAIELMPNFADGYANLGGALLLLDRKDEALAACVRAVELAPNHPEALSSFAHALLAVNEIADAIAIARRAVDLRPGYGPAHSDFGCVLHQDGQFEEAIAAHKKAMELAPSYAEARNNLGIVYRDLGRFTEALDCYRKAIALKPNYAEAWSNKGVVLGQIGQSQDAVDAYQRAIEIDPQMLVAFINLAGALGEQDRLADALATYAKALTIEPDHPSALIDYHHLRRHACDWDGLAAVEQKIIDSTYRKGYRVPSFPILNISGSAEDHLLSAREWAKGIKSPIAVPFTHLPPRGAPTERRLRIGYLSNDYCRHATASLIAELIERHDRNRFEVFGYCFSKNDGSVLRERLITAFDHFVRIDMLSHADAARRINHDGIDILIDLKGYTTGSRTEILAARPAPIQVNYLGYPGTMGAPFIDYIIADAFIAPMDQQPFFDEKIVHLPGCYQPNDTKRPIARVAPSRTECGLPETGFVFCSFNSSYKITPEMFSVWTRLLKGVPGSVLWLLESNPLMRENLRRKAASLGVDPARLVFAPKMELSVHLARHRNADLFLDSLPVNAHTTASDALWAGLPVLTCAGETLVSRVCGSLLKAVGLSELITYSLDHYERLALDLALNPDRIAQLKQRLAQNRDRAPLFDIGLYTEGFEAALEHMAELRERDEPPRAFAVNNEEAAAPLLPAGDVGTGKASFWPAAEPRPAVVTALPMAVAPVTMAEPDMPSAGAAVVERIAYEACPLCENPEFSHIRVAERPADHPFAAATAPAIIWCQCGACGHVFTEGYYSAEARETAFGQPAPHQTVGHDAETQRFIAGRVVGQIAKLKPGGEWLDVGAGDASLLFTAEEWGYRPVATDWRRENVRMLEHLGYEAYCTALEELDMPGRFSVVSMSDVLQETPYPRTTLATAKRLLQPGGILFLTLPNMANIVWRVMDSTDSNPYWGEVEHFHNFTRERLYALLGETGFRPIFYNVSERYRACMDVIAMSG